MQFFLSVSPFVAGRAWFSDDAGINPGMLIAVSGVEPHVHRRSA